MLPTLSDFPIQLAAFNLESTTIKSPISCLALLSVLVFAVSCSTDHKPTANTPAAAKNNSASLVGTDWLLLDLGGTPVVPNSKASLAFLDSGLAAGNASCNRFTAASKSPAHPSSLVRLPPLAWPVSTLPSAPRKMAI